MCDSILSHIEINNEYMMQYPYGNTWGFSVNLIEFPQQWNSCVILQDCSKQYTYPAVVPVWARRGPGHTTNYKGKKVGAFSCNDLFKV